MAYATIAFENPHTGETKEAPVGFSWTVFFFGFFPPIFRNDWKWALIILVFALITWGLSSLVFMFIYNKLYIKDLISAGFKVKSVETGSIDEISKSLEINLPLLETT
jgi:hypothetical protein